MNAYLTYMWHKSIRPCDLWGTAHVCLLCAMAANSAGAINDIAIALENNGVNCFVDQTGGLVMVGVVEHNGGTYLFNDGLVSFKPFPYRDDSDDANDYDMDILLEYPNDYELPELTADYVNKAVALIVGRVNA